MDKKPEIIHAAEPFLLKGSQVGCLLIHGFTGTPFEMRLLARSLADDGYTVLAPRLFGHATDPDDLSRARWWDWIADIEDSLAILKGITDHQIVLGLSLGGALALLVAARYQIDAAVSFSTPSDLAQDSQMKYLRRPYWLMPTQFKRKKELQNLHTGKDQIDYPYFPKRSLLELQSLLQTMRAELPSITIPLLFSQSHDDSTIPPESMNYLYEHVSSEVKSRLWLEKSGHVIIRGSEREKVFASTKIFIKQTLSKNE
jgi:carboxylesterase